MIFNLFKKKENNKIETHLISVKIKKNKNIFVGQILTIIPDISSNGTINYYFESYQDGILTNKINNKEIEYCEKYRYGIVKKINDDIADILIICCDGYLQRLSIKLYENFNNGDAFLINSGKLYSNNNFVGIIKDTRYNEQLKILFNVLDNDKLIVFIKK